MSDEDSGKAPYERHPVAVASAILLLFFGAVYATAVYFGYAPNIFTILFNPVVGITLGAVFVFVLLIGGLLWLKNSGNFGSYERADQWTKRQADRVSTRMHRNRGFLARRIPLNGVDYVQSGSSENDDYARIYEKVIEPKTDDNRKCILINLEQSIKVDVDDRSSIDRAIMSINDSVFFSEDAVGDFHEARENYKEKLAGSSPGETVIEEKPDGSVIRRNVSERTIEKSDKNQENQTVEQEN